MPDPSVIFVWTLVALLFVYLIWTDNNDDDEGGGCPC